MSVRPSTKQIASRILDLPEPLSPVIALKDPSHPVTCVLTGYDLKPSKRSITKLLGTSTSATFKDQFLDSHSGGWGWQLVLESSRPRLSHCDFPGWLPLHVHRHCPTVQLKGRDDRTAEAWERISGSHPQTGTSLAHQELFVPYLH